MPTEINDQTIAEQRITEQEIGDLVDRFYAKVRLDGEIGPIFNAIVGDWPHHLAKLKDFWSSALLGTGRYKGHPMMAHLQLPLDPIHFHRWLTLFEETAKETLAPAHAAEIMEKSHRIAENFQAGIAYRRGSEVTNS
jgi:hemoglobin